MKIRAIALSLIIAGLSSSAMAQTQLSAKQQYSIDTKRAATRYAEDKKLCAEESTSSARMQCTRDAKSEYNNALASAKAAQKAGSAKPVACHDCGRVIGVSVSEKAGEGGAVGMIAGGVAGALLGNQVGGGTGKKLATIAGAAGGAYAGKTVEGKMKSANIWTVQVQYDNGTQNSYTFEQDPGLAKGDLVRSSNGSIVRK